MSARKSPSQRANRDPIVYDDLPIAWDGKTRGPQLPEGYDWCDMTRRWWKIIRNSAQAMAFQETDWVQFLETAFLHNRFWGTQVVVDRDGNSVRTGVRPNEATALAAEIRRRTESYGFTWSDRRKYGIHITTPEHAAEEAEQITRQSAVDYRKKLNGLD
jgi:hypothetical protein